MNKYFVPLIFVLTLVISIAVSSCQIPLATSQSDHNDETALESDIPTINRVVFDGMLAKLNLDDLVNDSDAIITGKVAEILPSRKIQSSQFKMEIICTDVIIEPVQYFYGKSQEDRIAVQVWGGQIGDTVYEFSDSPIFKLGEEVTLFLQRLPQEEIPPLGIKPADYYMVYGSGKYELKDGIITGQLGEKFSISELEQKVAIKR